MTNRQQALLSYITEFHAEYGFSPSFDEMAAHLGLASKSGIARLVDGLVDRGHLRREGYVGRARALVPATEYQAGYRAGYAEAMADREPAHTVSPIRANPPGASGRSLNSTPSSERPFLSREASR